MGKFKFRKRGHRVHTEMIDQDSVPLRAVVPNLVTSCAACCGITSICFASEGRFLPAMWALLIAAVCDGVDGRIARLMHASSKLGAELDSLADFVNFGVAPALFMFFWLTGGPVHEGFSAPVVRVVLGCSLFYAMCDCFRLARFNTMLEQPQVPYWKHFFTGVPAPGGCWMVLSPAIIYYALDAKDTFPALQELFKNPYFGSFMLLFVGALMASRFPTISLKSIHIERKYLPAVMGFLLLMIAFLVSNFWLTLGIAGFCYILTVPITAWSFVRVRTKYYAGNNHN